MGDWPAKGNTSRWWSGAKRRPGSTCSGRPSCLLEASCSASCGSCITNFQRRPHNSLLFGCSAHPSDLCVGDLWLRPDLVAHLILTFPFTACLLFPSTSPKPPLRQSPLKSHPDRDEGRPSSRTRVGSRSRIDYCERVFFHKHICRASGCSEGT